MRSHRTAHQTMVIPETTASQTDEIDNIMIATACYLNCFYFPRSFKQWLLCIMQCADNNNDIPMGKRFRAYDSWPL